MLERRWERRLLCADLVQIEWEDRAGRTCNATAILEDISRSGACLQTDVQIPANAVVRMRHGRKTLDGTITYCTYRDIGYFAGMAFRNKQHWSQRVFRPKHLVDLYDFDVVAESKPG